MDGRQLRAARRGPHERVEQVRESREIPCHRILVGVLVPGSAAAGRIIRIIPRSHGIDSDVVHAGGLQIRHPSVQIVTGIAHHFEHVIAQEENGLTASIAVVERRIRAPGESGDGLSGRHTERLGPGGRGVVRVLEGQLDRCLLGATARRGTGCESDGEKKPAGWVHQLLCPGLAGSSIRSGTARL